MSNTEKFEKIEGNFENAKKVVEFLERLMKIQKLDYDAHVERLQSLHFLYQRLVTLKELELSELERQDKGAKDNQLGAGDSALHPLADSGWMTGDSKAAAESLRIANSIRDARLSETIPVDSAKDDEIPS